MVINVYAFCNVHDVSCEFVCTRYDVLQFADLFELDTRTGGTKGATAVATDLGVVKASGADKEKVDVDVPSDEKDIDAAYEDAKHVLAQKPPKEVKKVDLVQKAEDSYKNIRTNVVLVW